MSKVPPIVAETVSRDRSCRSSSFRMLRGSESCRKLSEPHRRDIDQECLKIRIKSGQDEISKGKQQEAEDSLPAFTALVVVLSNCTRTMKDVCALVRRTCASAVGAGSFRNLRRTLLFETPGPTSPICCPRTAPPFMPLSRRDRAPSLLAPF